MPVASGKAAELIKRNPPLPDHFLVLEQRERFDDYARDDGDAIAEHYENRGAIVVPHVPIRFDLGLIKRPVFTPEMKKIGNANGLEGSVVKRNDRMSTVDAEHLLVALFDNMSMAAFTQAQIRSFDGQLRTGLA